LRAGLTLHESQSSGEFGCLEVEGEVPQLVDEMIDANESDIAWTC
jgi:hypothetical protein